MCCLNPSIDKLHSSPWLLLRSWWWHVSVLLNVCRKCFKVGWYLQRRGRLGWSPGVLGTLVLSLEQKKDWKFELVERRKINNIKTLMNYSSLQWHQIIVVKKSIFIILNFIISTPGMFPRCCQWRPRLWLVDASSRDLTLSSYWLTTLALCSYWSGDHHQSPSLLVFSDCWMVSWLLISCSVCCCFYLIFLDLLLLKLDSFAIFHPLDTWHKELYFIEWNFY